MLTGSARLLAGAVAALFVAALGLACGSGSAPERARIVFYSARDGDEDVYIMETDGANVRQLTDEPGRDYEPDAAPDGRTVVFASQRETGDSSQLYLMDVDGSDVRRLTFSASGPNDPKRVLDDYAHWSPDGRRVVFQRTRISDEGVDSDIWLVDIATGEGTQLTQGERWNSTPSFSADGLSILFESNRSGDFDIYRMELESGELTRLTDAPGIDSMAKESPDGKLIAFMAERDETNAEVYLMDADGGNVRRLTDSELDDECPQWSPDGKLLTFQSSRDGDQEIYVMAADGSGQTRLTESPGTDGVADWVP